MYAKNGHQIELSGVLGSNSRQSETTTELEYSGYRQMRS